MAALYIYLFFLLAVIAICGARGSYFRRPVKDDWGKLREARERERKARGREAARHVPPPIPWDGNIEAGIERIISAKRGDK